MSELPNGYVIKNIKGCAHWWVDGACGYCVASGNTRKEAVDNALRTIQAFEDRRKNSIGCPAWYVY